MFDGVSVGFNVNNVFNNNLFFLDGFVYGGVEMELFGIFDGFEINDNVRNGFVIFREGVFGFGRSEFGDFIFVYFFCFFNF